MRTHHGLEVLPTTSCTDALEMAALLAEVGPGDEVVVPSFTFVSSALAFAMRGSTLAFADSHPDFPHVGWDNCAASRSGPRWSWSSITVVPATIRIEAECASRGIVLVEDAAQAIGVRYGKGETARWLGSFGDAATFSFHETKNLHCGEGGALCLNRESWKARASVLWEKGTNRKAFFQGLVDKYGWVDFGSSFLPNEMTMAYLMGQMERCEVNSRIAVGTRTIPPLTTWNPGAFAASGASPGGGHNGHLFYILLGCGHAVTGDFCIEGGRHPPGVPLPESPLRG